MSMARVFEPGKSVGPAAMLGRPARPVTARSVDDSPDLSDAVLERLLGIQRELVGLVAARDIGDPVSEAVRIDRIAQLERLQSAVEAVKAVEIVGFARSRAIQRVVVDGMHPLDAERGIADEIALACRVPPTEGSHRLRTARDLVLDMPNMLDLLMCGDIHPYTARRVCGQLSHLDCVTRREVDQTLAGQELDRKSGKQAERAAQRAAYEADPVGSTQRASNARNDRRVTLRPAPDTMSLLTGLLPVEQGVACLNSLEEAVRQAKASGDQRTKGQIMADTMVTRLTGQEQATDTGFEVGVIMPLSSLIDPDDPSPAEIPGHGWLPAGLFHGLLQNGQVRSWWRRLFTRPTKTGGNLIVDLDQRRRRFTGPIAELIRWRDQTCRDPYCDAPIRHLDHIQRHSDGGPTTHQNGRGVCERGNHVRELPGWTVRLLDPDDHTVITITPTGHQYTSNPPEPP